MIKLHNILTEIIFGSVQPYATQFAWHRKPGGFETDVVCDGIEIQFSLDSNWSADGEEYSFAIVMPGGRGGSGYTISHRESEVTGQLSYLRVLQTAGEAILDFCSQYAPSAIDVTGSDPDAGKDLQKTRIYRNLLHANAAKIASAGYDILDQRGKLYLVRKSNADATGVK